jgi:hypothetical protein
MIHLLNFGPPRTTNGPTDARMVLALRQGLCDGHHTVSMFFEKWRPSALLTRIGESPVRG